MHPEGLKKKIVTSFWRTKWWSFEAYL